MARRWSHTRLEETLGDGLVGGMDPTKQTACPRYVTGWPYLFILGAGDTYAEPPLARAMDKVVDGEVSNVVLPLNALSSKWSPSTWVASREPQPSPRVVGSRGIYEYHLPCDSLYRYKRLDRPDRQLTHFSDAGDPFTTEGPFLGEWHHWYNEQIRLMERFGQVDDHLSARWDRNPAFSYLLGRTHPRVRVYKEYGVGPTLGDLSTNATLDGASRRALETQIPEAVRERGCYGATQGGQYMQCLPQHGVIRQNRANAPTLVTGGLASSQVFH